MGNYLMFRSQRFLHPLGEQVKQRECELTGKQVMAHLCMQGLSPSSCLTLKLQVTLTRHSQSSWLLIIQEFFETLLGTIIFLHTLWCGRGEQDAPAETWGIHLLSAAPQGLPSPHLISKFIFFSPSGKHFSLIFTYSRVWTRIMSYKQKTPTQRNELWLIQCKATVTKRMEL